MGAIDQGVIKRQQRCAQCSDYDIGMPEGVRRALMDRAAKTPRHGLEVNLYPNTYYGFAIRGDRRDRDERDRCPAFRRATAQWLLTVTVVI